MGIHNVGRDPITDRQCRVKDSTRMHTNRVLVLFILLAGVSNPVLHAGQTSVVSSITVQLTNPGGIQEIGIQGTPVQLTVYEIPHTIFPGQPYTSHISTDSRLGNRLHYTVFSELQPKKIVVYTMTPIPEGLLTVEIVNAEEVFGNGFPGEAVTGQIAVTETPADLITGIGNCFTGNLETDGPQIRYRLNGAPVAQQVGVYYELVDDV